MTWKKLEINSLKAEIKKQPPSGGFFMQKNNIPKN